MKKKVTFLLAAVFGLLGFTGTSSAVTLVAGPFSYKGNSSPEAETERLVEAVNTYNSSSLVDLPEVDELLYKLEPNAKTVTLGLDLEDFQNQYILFKYATINLIYFIGEETGTYDFKFPDLKGKFKELSHYTVFSSVAPEKEGTVPDAGGSAALLALGLAGTVAARKFRNASK